MKSPAHLVYLLLCWSLGAAVSAQPIGGADHPCYRQCDGVPQVCEYTFTVSEEVSMSSKCGSCPYAKQDCFNKGCMTAGGNARFVSVINSQLPGTSIQVCYNDTVVINMANELPIEGTTIHWHGIHQKEKPYMDGTPFVTQCPVLPHDSFRYEWRADTPGTHMWHSHVGYEEADGMFGSLVVRRPVGEEPNADLYDQDLAEHVVVVWHWYPQPTKQIQTMALFLNEEIVGSGLIVNGKGHIKTFTTNGNSYETPVETFNVTRGVRYRFRVIFNSALPCPVQMSVDSHSLLVIASDGGSVSPVEVDSIMLNAGERYDFVLTANQEADNYWIRFRGAGGCASTTVHQEAVLHYIDAASNGLPNGSPTYQEAAVPGKMLNPSEGLNFANYSSNDLIYLTELTSNEQDRLDISGTPDQILYYELGEWTYPDSEYSSRYPQINNVTFSYPSIPLFTQREQVTPAAYCTNANLSSICQEGHICHCPYIFEIKLGSLVEVVFLDPSSTARFSHPMHLHGYDFEVVAMGYLNSSYSLEAFQEANELGLIEKKLVGAPIKDTVSIPPQGYTIMRFWANNPGYWIFHCHISLHADLGMITVLKIGEHSDMVQVPDNFPRCGNWELDE